MTAGFARPATAKLYDCNTALAVEHWSEPVRIPDNTTVSLVVYDLFVKEILRLEDAAHKQRDARTKTLYVHGLPPGGYYITFRTSDIAESRMFVKQ